MQSDFISRAQTYAASFGFSACGFAALTFDSTLITRYENWLSGNQHAEMQYLANHLSCRKDPTLFFAEATGAIMVLLPSVHASTIADSPIARFAQGRDYHKVLSKRLKNFGAALQAQFPDFQCRAFVDSAPVFEKPLAVEAGLGFQGKHTLLIDPACGSYFVLGGLLCNLTFEARPPAQPNRCGSCRACIDACPTGALSEPGILDARRCIAYLTIEHKGDIPLELRSKIGTHIFGCDACQNACPWNRFAKISACADFQARDWVRSDLANFLSWDEATFLAKTEGMAIRRIGYLRWLRNIAVALGNAPDCERNRQALLSRANFPDAMVRRHVEWAIAEIDKRRLGA